MLMTSLVPPSRPLVIARGIILLWAAWWSFFAIASSVNPVPPLAELVYPAAVVAGVIMQAWLLWRWPTAGALSALILGLGLGGWYLATSNPQFPVSTVVFVLATLPLPLLLAALLVWWSRRPLSAAVHPGQ